MLNKLTNFIRNFRIDTNFTKFIVSFLNQHSFTGKSG